MNARWYAGADDLARMQAALAEWRADDPCGHLHPGDVPHRIYNGPRHHDPGRNVRLWGDAGFLLIYPQWNAFDYEHEPGRDDLAEEMIVLAERELAARATSDKALATESWDCDAPRSALLAAHGYRPGQPQHTITSRVLDGIPAPVVPGGFSIRAAAGPDDAAALADVHAMSFESSWTAAEYAQLMATPGYDPARELVVVAPDGRFAAFCILWFDHRNAEGLFEPVGTHGDFRRLGLARALLDDGMRRMREAGMRTATVVHDNDNPAAAGLYAAAGFGPRAVVSAYAKTG